MEHAEWKGEKYEFGIGGQKVAIAGYSHHSNDKDYQELTVNLLRSVANEKIADIRFFNAIASYFPASMRSGFWHRVIFFNFVPEAIGAAEKRYAWASEGQVRAGQERALRIMAEHRPDKLLVLSTKAWTSFPKTIEEEAGGKCHSLFAGRDDFHWGRYLFDRHQVTAVGLRHPQGARTALMVEAVSAALALGSAW